MMDCGGDSGEDSGGLEDFVDSATDITDNSRTIRGNLLYIFQIEILSMRYKYPRLDNCIVANNPLKS